MNLRIFLVHMGAKPNLSILRSCHCEYICSLMLVLTSPHNVYLQLLTSIKFASGHVFQNQFWNCLHIFLISTPVKVEYDVMAHIAKVLTLLWLKSSKKFSYIDEVWFSERDLKQIFRKKAQEINHIVNKPHFYSENIKWQF